ncbi:hypothetical protein GXW82_07720 [Streptacidiphilus sp. 4-A2]|nr:hypothetical protein [Streptacidiphilus sp. 4-A2]
MTGRTVAASAFAATELGAGSGFVPRSGPLLELSAQERAKTEAGFPTVDEVLPVTPLPQGLLCHAPCDRAPAPAESTSTRPACRPRAWPPPWRRPTADRPIRAARLPAAGRRVRARVRLPGDRTGRPAVSTTRLPPTTVAVRAGPHHTSTAARGQHLSWRQDGIA